MAVVWMLLFEVKLFTDHLLSVAEKKLGHIYGSGFSSLARILGECLITHSPPVLYLFLFFFK